MSRVLRVLSNQDVQLNLPDNRNGYVHYPVNCGSFPIDSIAAGPVVRDNTHSGFLLYTARAVFLNICYMYAPRVYFFLLARGVEDTLRCDQADCPSVPCLRSTDRTCSFPPTAEFASTYSVNR